MQLRTTQARVAGSTNAQAAEGERSTVEQTKKRGEAPCEQSFDFGRIAIHSGADASSGEGRSDPAPPPPPLSKEDEWEERRAEARARAVLNGAVLAPSRATQAISMPPLSEQAGPGRALPTVDAASFERGFGASFSQVRIYDDAHAARLADAAEARALTYGNHLYFGRGEYRPHTPQGRALLAHELAHVELGHGAAHRVWRQPKAAPAAAPQNAQKPDVERLQLPATGMDEAAKLLATILKQQKVNAVCVGLHPSFVKVYDPNGASLGQRVPIKKGIDITFYPGVYADRADGVAAITVLRGGGYGFETDAEGQHRSFFGHTPYSAQEKAQIAEEKRLAEKEKRAPKPPPAKQMAIAELVADRAALLTLVNKVPQPREIVFFVPKYLRSHGGKAGDAQGQYSSPIEGRADGEPANYPPWPVSVEGPKIVPTGATPTYTAKVDWSANGNFTLASQVISQVGENIHYRWERFDVTSYVEKEAAKEAKKGTQGKSAAKQSSKMEKSGLDQKLDELKTSQVGSGENVTGMGGAKREFRREFEDWWKDTKRAHQGMFDPSGDTLRERLSNAQANQLSLEMTPVSLLVTSAGATVRLIADVFAGPRVQQEIPLENKGTYLIRVIATPAIGEDTKGNRVVRPPSVGVKATEVMLIANAVRESLDEPEAQLAELERDIDLAELAGNKARADYLRELLAAAKEQFQGSPLAVLEKQYAKKDAELKQFRNDYPSLSDFTRQRAVDLLGHQIELFHNHEAKRRNGDNSLAESKRVNASLISEVTGQQYPLLLAAGPMANKDGLHQWMISDVTNHDGEAYTGVDTTPSRAFYAALTKFGGKAAYGRGKIGVRTAGLGLEEGCPPELFVDSAPTDWALAEKRLDDLVMTLALLGLAVASAGTVAAVVGAAVAAGRLIHRWQNGTLRLDGAAISDLLGVLGGIAGVGQTLAGLRVEKMGKVFAVLEESAATEAQLTKAAKAISDAQRLAKGVEVANEVLNYAGLAWGEATFIDQILEYNEAERNGTLTHAAARRQRATAISSAIQNNGIFIASNAIKAKQQAKAARTAVEPPAPKKGAPVRLATDPAAPKEGLPAEKSTEPKARDAVHDPPPDVEVPEAPTKTKPTLDQFKSQLPGDMHEMVVVDDTLEGDHVQVDWVPFDDEPGLIKEIKIRVGSEARLETVAGHADTARTMQKFQGFSGRVRKWLRQIAEVVNIKMLSPESPTFKATLEVRKLPKLIGEAADRVKNATEATARDMAEAELLGLQNQLDSSLRTLDMGGGSDGALYVAAKGVPTKNQKKFAEKKAELAKYEKGSDDHRRVRWEMYELTLGDMPREHWDNVYDANLKRANKANEIVKAEHERLGWGKTEQWIPDLPNGEERRLDIADVRKMKGVEIKAYASETVSATAENLSEAERDAMAVKMGWDITWLFIDCEPSGPLKQRLLEAGINIEVRHRSGGEESVAIIKGFKQKGARR